MDETVKTNKWKDLGAADKLKLSLSAGLVVASIVLGFISFILLFEIPGSVIGLDGLWLSTALAVMGISSHFNNELVKFKSEVRSRLNKLDEDDEILNA